MGERLTWWLIEGIVLFKINFGSSFGVQKKNECCLSGCLFLLNHLSVLQSCSQWLHLLVSQSSVLNKNWIKLFFLTVLNPASSHTVMVLHHFIWQSKEKYIWAPLSCTYPRVILCQVLYITIAAHCHWDLWRLVWKTFTIVLCTSFNAFLSVTPLMELKPNAGSDRAWVWNTHADFADESPKPELLAIRFLNAESEWTGTELTLIVNCYVTLLVWTLL